MASPLAATHPLPAAAFALGSALPDIDAVSRMFGKRAFLVAHQTFTHALPVIVLLAGLCWIALAMSGIEAIPVAAALMLGMIFHSLLDATNTYGITLWAPFTRRRFCTEWIFFIDAVVIAVTVSTLAWIIWRWPPTGPASGSSTVHAAPLLSSFSNPSSLPSKRTYHVPRSRNHR